MNCSLMIINLAPADSFDVIFIGILMSLREVNALRLIISVYGHLKQSISCVSALPKCIFSTIHFLTEPALTGLQDISVSLTF